MDIAAWLPRIHDQLEFVKVPEHYHRVFKDECMFSFDTPLSEGGLFLNLSTLQSYGEEYLELDFARRNDFPLYLHTKWTRVPLSDDEMEKSEPEKMAIGVEGGFQVDKEKFKTEKSHTLVLLPDQIRIPLPCDGLPTKLQLAIDKIEEHSSASMEQETAAWEEEKVISKYAENLEQLPSEKKISMDPSDWACEDSGMKENLWLNLSTGYVGSGRENWLGLGGTGAALKHYEATGKRYPLAVKLGTITAAGADVYSYAPDEDCMVKDPYLEKHLSHWGIDMKTMEKTEKTMVEMEVEMNMVFEFNRITEASTALVPVHGPGCVGLKNLGNSCYMNAVLQVLWTVPEVRECYLSDAQKIFLTSSPDPSHDFLVQMAKLGIALIEGRTGRESGEDADPDAWSVRPLSFKTLVGRGHADFSTAFQQDSSHYFTHLLEVMDTAEKRETERLTQSEGRVTSHMFAFSTEQRTECTESRRVRYNASQNLVLELDIPLEMATNRSEVDDYKDRQMKRQKLQESGADAEISIEAAENGTQRIVEITKNDTEEKVLPEVPFAACLSRYVADVVVDDYYSQHLKRNTRAIKRTKLKTFPPYLMVQLKRYYVDAAWQPQKMEVLVEPPEKLNLEAFRGTGPQPNELLQPESDDDASGHPIADINLVEQLVSMGFPENGCKRAAIAVNNESLESAMEWVLSHMEDPGFNDAIENAPSRGTDNEKRDLLTDMGFSADAATAALIECKDNSEAAVNWLITHTAELDALVPQILAQKGPDPEQSQFIDGEGRYRLIGFISHMGTSTACGHYVCHIKKDGRWILFNDEKVAISESPPRDLGYMYLYDFAMCSQSVVQIRALTLFTPLLENRTLSEAEYFFETATKKLTDAGFVVQTCRLATDSVGYDRGWLRQLDQELNDRGWILNMGPMSDPNEIENLLAETQNLFFSYRLDTDISDDVLQRLAALIQRIASDQGVHGSFRFCVTSECPPYIPYFPASYSLRDDPPSFAIGIESSRILHASDDGDGDIRKIEQVLRDALTPVLQSLESVCFKIEEETEVHYRHIDSSLCPRLESPSMTAFWNRHGVDVFGRPGTLSICAAITKALKSIPVRQGGFCGLMLPVCEDAGLVNAVDQKAFRISDLLYYSTVCACGLDCVPVPGYSDDPAENRKTEQKIAAYLCDMHSIATRLKKPLSCRLLPVPNKKPGEPTGFNFEHLVDGPIMEL